MRKLFFKNALLPGGWARNVNIEIDAAGMIASVTKDSDAKGRSVDATIAVSGLPNVHSHAFQRAMAGLAEFDQPGKDDFWSWRTTMYQFVAHLTPDDVLAIAAQLYMEMLEAGYTSVGEFHYLHHQRHGVFYDHPAEIAERIIEASHNTGIGLTLLPVFYAHGDFGGAESHENQQRFINTVDGFARLLEGARSALKTTPGAVLGIAPHSLRAVAPSELRSIIKLRVNGPIHIHIAEQIKEVDDCLGWSGERPVAWLLDHMGVDENWCLIHATHMNGAETDALAKSGAVVGLCPSTEANLGDGVFNGARYHQTGGRWAVGSDSHIRIDAAEELRGYEYSQRLIKHARNVICAEAASTGRTLFDAAVSGGAQALGRKTGALASGFAADILALDEDHRVLVGKYGDQWLDGWIFSGGKDCIEGVWVRGRKVIEGREHVSRQMIEANFRRCMTDLLAR